MQCQYSYVFFNSGKNKSNFNVYFSENVFLNSSSVFCFCTASVFFTMTVRPHAWRRVI